MGVCKIPGHYVIPSYSTLSDILSLAGGPLEDATLNDVRIYRQQKDSEPILHKYDINDLLWADSLATKIVLPQLKAGDIVLVPGEPRYFVREDIAFYLSITTALASLAALIISITK